VRLPVLNVVGHLPVLNVVGHLPVLNVLGRLRMLSRCMGRSMLGRLCVGFLLCVGVRGTRKGKTAN
jgi:hypothetical protein